MTRLVAALAACLLIGCITSSAQAAPLTWGAPTSVDRYQVFGKMGQVRSISCVGDTACFAIGDVDGAVLTVSENPAADAPVWRIPRAFDYPGGVYEIACPTLALCVVLGNKTILSSTNPAAERADWKATTIPDDPGNIFKGLMEYVSCPATTFCAATDRAGHVYVSTNPGAASPVWTATTDPIAAGATGLSCASSTLCAISGTTGKVRISTNPAAPAPAWSTTDLNGAGDNALTSISCPTTTFCMAGAEGDVIYRSVNPATAAPEWTPVATPVTVRAISCPTPQMCTATNGGATTITSTDPGAATPTWRQRSLGFGSRAFTCGTPSFCIVVSNNEDNRTAVARDVAQPSPSPTWKEIGRILGRNVLSASECPDETLCVLGDTSGRLLTTANPTAIDPLWRMSAPPGAGRIVAAECPSPTLCVAITANGRSIISHNPRDAAPTWVQDFAPPGLKDLSCPSVDRCVGVTAGQTAVLSDVSKIATIDVPGPVWGDLKDVDGAVGVTSIACPTATQCAAVDSSNKVFTTADVTAADPVWVQTATPLEGGIGFADLSCPTTSLCVAVDAALLRAFSSTNPFAAAPVWNGPTANVGNLVSCPLTTFCVSAILQAVRTATDLAPALPMWSPFVFAGDDRNSIQTLACANDRLCLVGDDTGVATFGVAVPQNIAAPTVSGDAVAGSALAAAGGSWTGVPGTELQWERCDAAGGGCTAIEGATGTTFAVSAADVGSTLRVTETATNAGGSAGSPSAATAIVPPLPVVIAPPPPPKPPVPPVVDVQALLGSVLGVTGSGAKLAKILKSGYTTSFTAPSAGRLVIRWYSIKTKRKKVILIGSARVNFTAAGKKKKVVVKLNRAGKRLLRRAKRIKITVKATWTPLGGKAVTVTKRVTLKR